MAKFLLELDCERTTPGGWDFWNDSELHSNLHDAVYAAEYAIDDNYAKEATITSAEFPNLHLTFNDIDGWTSETPTKER